MNVIVCEDNEGIQGLMKIILEDIGHDVYICSDDVSLNHILAKTKADLVIMDYWLGKTKSDGIISDLKERYKSLPIILISAIHNLKKVAKKLKTNDFIEKPFDIEVFKSKVNNLLHDTNNSTH